MKGVFEDSAPGLREITMQHSLGEQWDRQKLIVLWSCTLTNPEFLGPKSQSILRSWESATSGSNVSADHSGR